MSDLYPLIKPVLFALDAETAHKLTLQAMKAGLFPKPPEATQDNGLETEICGLKFPNPVGLAAGFDKNAEIIHAAFALGFGFVEAGTVTPKPQDGNPRPRVFRSVADEAVINRMGFPNGGGTAFKQNLSRFLSRPHKPRGVLGLNIGMNKDQTDPAKDYCLLVKMLAPMSDYITINISSPNTPGLRDLQSREPLLDLLGQVIEERKRACGGHPPPLFLKLAPDLSAEQRAELARTVQEAGIDGLILTNTTLARPEFLPEAFRSEKGGLSGAPLRDLSTEVIADFYRLMDGNMPIIGAGGISSGEDAYAKIRAGASLVQLYSALAYRGPLVVHYVNKRLRELLTRDGFARVSEAVGADFRAEEGLKYDAASG